jgi:hypothetical protein
MAIVFPKNSLLVGPRLFLQRPERFEVIVEKSVLLRHNKLLQAILE